MKLIRLKLNEQFRSLQKGFELHFRRELDLDNENEFAPFVLAGLNGSGKSNVLEVLASIFFHLECQYLNFLPSNFEYEKKTNPKGFQGKNGIPDAFELDYCILTKEGMAQIRVIKKKNKSAKLFWQNNEELKDGALSRLKAKEVLPEFVLGYSSGENEVLSLPFFKMRFIQYDEYLDLLKKNYDYPGKPESSHIYMDNEFSQAILISNFLLEDEEVLKPFHEDVGITKLNQFRMILRDIEVEREIPPESLGLGQYAPGGNPADRVTNLLNRFIDEVGVKNSQAVLNKLKKCATTHYHDEETDTHYLDFWVNDASKNLFKLHFGSAVELFESFQILLTLNLYSVSDELKKDLYTSPSQYVKETVPTLASDERIMRFKFVEFETKSLPRGLMLRDLSDGEHQFLHSLGMCLLYRNSNSLFLLDEPETHFNPDWRSKFISRLRDCFAQKSSDLENKSEVRREMLITTHSPFLISDSKKEHVLEFSKDPQSREVSVQPAQYHTFGASVDQITMKTFNKSETIGGVAEELINDFKERFKKGEDSEELIGEVKKRLGDSIERLLLIQTLKNKKN